MNPLRNNALRIAVFSLLSAVPCAFAGTPEEDVYPKPQAVKRQGSAMVDAAKLAPASYAKNAAVKGALQDALNLFGDKVGFGSDYYVFKEGKVYTNTTDIIRVERRPDIGTRDGHGHIDDGRIQENPLLAQLEFVEVGIEDLVDLLHLIQRIGIHCDSHCFVHIAVIYRIRANNLK